MAKITNVALIVLAGVLSAAELAAQSQSTTTTTADATVITAGSGKKMSGGDNGTVFLHETFENFDVDSVPTASQLQRSNLVKVVDGGGKVGSAKVAHYNDDDTETGGAMEYTVGDSAITNLYIEFDALNNAPDLGDKNSQVIFGVGPWEEGKSLTLNSKSKRAFGFEMYQQKSLRLRVGDESISRVDYDSTAAFNVKIWANDHDGNTFSYKRPDNGETAELGPDSVVVWLNDALMGDLKATGTPMHKDITEGNAVIGRVGLSSASTKVANFLFDNLHFQGQVAKSEKSTTDQPSEAAAPSTEDSSSIEQTPSTLPGAETIIYRRGENEMNLFVFKPEGWQASDERSSFVFFFGGGWSKGTPSKSAATAKWAAANGMVGIAPDYRTKNRFDTTPLASVADGRAAFAWVVEHADELGIDPARIAVGGSSAGGHVALWTAIEKAPPGSDAATSPRSKPAAVVLKSAVTDTSPETGYTPKRFGDDALALSPVHQLDAKMPPTLILHAAMDELVHYGTAVALYNKLASTGNACELVTIPLGGHGFTSEYKQWKPKVNAKMVELFKREGLLPAVR